MTTNKKWKSHTKIKNNVLTVLRSFNQLDTHFSYIILSNGFPPSNTRHQLNNHKHNTHPHTHLPGQRCIDAAHRHCTTNPNDECCSDTAGSKAVTLLVNSSGKRSHCTYCQFCVLPCTRVFVLTAICRVELYVMLSVEFFVCSEGQWPIEYSYAGFASFLTSTIRHPATSELEKTLKSFSLHNLSAARKYTTFILLGLLDR